jgi:hypothetical protein
MTSGNESFFSILVSEPAIVVSAVLLVAGVIGLVMCKKRSIGL